MSKFICAECGSELTTGKKEADFDYADDIGITMELFPCDTCITKAFNEGKEEVK